MKSRHLIPIFCWVLCLQALPAGASDANSVTITSRADFQKQIKRGRTTLPHSDAKASLQRLLSSIKDARHNKRSARPDRRRNLTANAVPRSGNNLRPLMLRDRTGKTRAIKGELEMNPTSRIRAGGSMRGTDAYHLLDANHDLFGLGADNSLRHLRTQKTPGGSQHFRYQREFQGLPVFGRELVVNTLGGRTYMVSGDFAPVSENLNTSVTLSSQAIERAAMRSLQRDASHVTSHTQDKIILRLGNRHRVAYKVDLTFDDQDAWRVFIDAENGRVLHRIHQIRHLTSEGSGVDLAGNSQTFTVSHDETGQLFTLFDPDIPSGGSAVYDGVSEALVHAPAVDGPWDPAAVSVFTGQRSIYDYFSSTFGRDSLDGKGIELASLINLESQRNNAAWNGAYMLFGPGDGEVITSTGFAGCLDVIAHEFSHGVNGHTANLVYENQSGALDESFADFFGAMVDRDDWLLSEDCWLASPGYLRSLEDPASGASPQPAHMDEYARLSIFEDNGGVHVNSGIPNRVAYVVATELGKDVAEQIWYQGLLSLTRFSGFLDARIATIAAAESLHGVQSPEAAAVAAAWDAGGVTADLLPIESGGTDIIEAMTGQDYMVYLYPEDASHQPFGDEPYRLYVQEIPEPFEGYEPTKDVGPLTTSGLAAYTRPAPLTFQDELEIYFVGVDGNIYGVVNGEQQQYTDDGIYNALSMSPNARYAATSVFVGPFINILDFDTGETLQVEVTGPDFSQSGNTDSLVTRVDAVAFDYSSQKIIFDFAICLPTASVPCFTADSVEYWSIGIYDLRREAFKYPFPSQSSDFDVGFPRFASNSNRFFVYDRLDWSEFDELQSTISTIHQYDVDSGDDLMIANADPGNFWPLTFGLPSYDGDDKYIVFQQFDSLGGRAKRIPVTGFVPATDEQVELSPFDVAMPVMHRNAVRDVSAELVTESLELNFGNILLGDEPRLSVVLSNTGNRVVDIQAVTSSSAATHNLANGSLAAGEQLTFSAGVKFDREGIFNEHLTIAHTGDNEDLVINMLAVVGLDSDDDGVPDSLDLFPNDASESADQDQDGIGDNSDTDDDNDGRLDIEDDFPLSNYKTDINSDGSNDALTDGVLVMRYLFGFRGEFLSLDPAVESFLSANASSLYDVDGDGEILALTDGLLILRAMFGFTGNVLTNGAVSSTCMRCSNSEIEAQLETLL